MTSIKLMAAMRLFTSLLGTVSAECIFLFFSYFNGFPLTNDLATLFPVQFFAQISKNLKGTPGKSTAAQYPNNTMLNGFFGGASEPFSMTVASLHIPSSSVQYSSFSMSSLTFIFCLKKVMAATLVDMKYFTVVLICIVMMTNAGHLSYVCWRFCSS